MFMWIKILIIMGFFTLLMSIDVLSYPWVVYSMTCPIFELSILLSCRINDFFWRVVFWWVIIDPVYPILDRQFCQTKNVSFKWITVFYSQKLKAINIPLICREVTSLYIGVFDNFFSPFIKIPIIIYL